MVQLISGRPGISVQEICPPWGICHVVVPLDGAMAFCFSSPHLPESTEGDIFVTLCCTLGYTYSNNPEQCLERILPVEVSVCGKGLDGFGVHDCHFKYLLNARLTQTFKR